MLVYLDLYQDEAAMYSPILSDLRFTIEAFHYVRTHLGEGGGSSLLYISIAYYIEKRGGWIACKIV